MSAGSPLPYALACVNRGWYVFPVWWVENGRCACGQLACDQPGKHPIADCAPRGVLDATIYVKVVKSWWDKYPNANIAIATGRSGLIVADLDLYHGVLERDFDAKIGGSVETVRVITGGGGLHLWYTAPPGNYAPSVSRFIRNVDIRAGNSYVIAPPSTHISGNQYYFEVGYDPGEIKVAACPQALADFARVVVSASSNGTGPKVGDAADQSTGFDILKALYGVPEGERNDTIFRAACSFRGTNTAKKVALKLCLDAAAKCNPPYSATETRSIVDRVYKRYPAGGQEQKRAEKAHLIEAEAGNAAGIDEKALGPLRVPLKDFFERRKLYTEKSAWCAALVETLIKRGFFENYFARDVTGALWYYRGGTYQLHGERLIRHAVKTVVSAEKWNNTLANETVERVRADAPFLLEKPPVDVINIANGLLDLKTHELRPHDPAHLSPVQLPVTYDRTATCDDWDQQARETFPDDAYNAGVHWQVVAWLMVAYTSLQKALLLIGEGGTGKSTFLRAVVAFLGRCNISAESLQQLEEGRFSSASLIGKLANVCADLPSTHLESSATFKRITGEDPISTERKFRDCVELTIYARLVFSANIPPIAADATDAFFDRWYVLPFDKRYRGTDKEIRSEELDAKLANPRQLSGVLNKALKVLPGVLKTGLTVTESMRQALLTFRQETDPVAVWLIRRTVYDPANNNLFVVCTALREEYNRDAATAGKPGMNETAFGRALKALRPGVGRKQRTFAGKAGTWIYEHIALRARETPP